MSTTATDHPTDTIDEQMTALLRQLAADEPVHPFRFPVRVVDRAIETGLVELAPCGRLCLSEAGRVSAYALTPRAKRLRLATAFGRPISDAAARALDVVAHHATDDELAALAAEIHALSVRPIPVTPARAHLEEWIT